MPTMFTLTIADFEQIKPEEIPFKVEGMPSLEKDMVFGKLSSAETVLRLGKFVILNVVDGVIYCAISKEDLGTKDDSLEPHGTTFPMGE